MPTEIEEMFLGDLILIKNGDYGFMGKNAVDLTHDELLIAYKYAVDKMQLYLNDIYELKKNQLCHY
jgi:hypothetical protein